MQTILQKILEQREKREVLIKLLSNKFNETVTCFKVNYPGPDKKSKIVWDIYQQGVNEFKEKTEEEKIPVIFFKENLNEAEYEFFSVLKLSPLDCKKKMIYFEENHALGRLWDFDVYDRQGKSIKRSAINLKPRTCLLCNNNLQYCKRKKLHSTKELTEKIKNIYKNYKKQSNGELQ